MKKTFFYAVALVAFAACSSKHSGKIEDAGATKELLAEKTISRTILKSEYPDSLIQNMLDPDGSLSESKFTDKEKIINTIIELAKSGKVKVYNWFNKDSLLSKQDIENIIARKDTLYSEDEKTKKIKIHPVIIDINPENIVYIDFEEDWSFNAEKMTFEKVVRRACLGKAVFSESGEFKGISQLFWVEFNH